MVPMARVTSPPIRFMCACASGSIMCPGPPYGLPIESSQVRMDGTTCNMPCMAPKKKETVETTRNLIRWGDSVLFRDMEVTVLGFNKKETVIYELSYMTVLVQKNRRENEVYRLNVWSL